jgi:hypothetical protein
MPYEVIHDKKGFAVKTTAGPNKGHLHGYTTKPKAEAQMRLLNMKMKHTRVDGSGHPHTSHLHPVK